MIDPPYVNPQYHVNIKRCAYRCAIPLAVLLTLVLAIVLVIYYLLLGFNMLPPAGTSPLILFGLQWWPIPEPGVVCPGSAAAYRLDEAWVGGSDRSFFDPDSWNFWHDTADPTGGPTQYVDHDTATANGLIEEGDGWAVIRAGRPVRPDSSDLVPSSFQGVEGPQMRQSVRMTSKRSWRRFLLSVRYTHLPYGCGLWPAVWFWCADVEPGPDGQPARCPAWPAGGELDVLEYSNQFYTKSSLHLGADAVCTLDADAIADCGNFVDKNSMQYHCETEYFPRDANGDGTPDRAATYGCASNDFGSWPTVRETLNPGPGAVVVEWTEDAIKIWHFPEAEIPTDLIADDPRPAGWDNARLWSYYPLDLSTCPGKASLGAQNLVLNMAFCGQWAGANWKEAHDDGTAPTLHQELLNTVFPDLFGQSCATEHGMGGHELPEDACTAHVLDEVASAHLERTGFFNLTHIKIFAPVE